MNITKTNKSLSGSSYHDHSFEASPKQLTDLFEDGKKSGDGKVNYGWDLELDDFE